MKTYKSLLLLLLSTTLLTACDLDKSIKDLGNQGSERRERGETIMNSVVREESSNDQSEAIDRPRPADEFIVSTLPQVPGYKIRHSQGYYCRMFAFDGYNYSSRFNQVISEIIQEGKKNGAHALVNMGTTAIPFNQMVKADDKDAKSSPSAAQFTNSQSIVQVCGDMVEIQSAAN